MRGRMIERPYEGIGLRFATLLLVGCWVLLVD